MGPLNSIHRLLTPHVWLLVWLHSTDWVYLYLNVLYISLSLISIYISISIIWEHAYGKRITQQETNLSSKNHFSSQPPPTYICILRTLCYGCFLPGYLQISKCPAHTWHLVIKDLQPDLLTFLALPSQYRSSTIFSSTLVTLATLRNAFLFLSLLLLLERRSSELMETKRTSFQRLVHSPMTCIYWGWARAKLGPRDFSQVSHIGGRNSMTWAIITWYFPGSGLAGS